MAHRKRDRYELEMIFIRKENEMVYSESNTPRRNEKIRFELVEHIGVLNKKDSGWTREVNIVSWNGNKPKVDIREWNPDHERMSRGVTLLEEEAERLAMCLAKRYGIVFPDNIHEQRREEPQPYASTAFSDEPARSETASVAADGGAAQGESYDAAQGEESCCAAQGGSCEAAPAPGDVDPNHSEW